MDYGVVIGGLTIALCMACIVICIFQDIDDDF